MHPYGIDSNERRNMLIIMVPVSFWISMGFLELWSRLSLPTPTNLDWIFDAGSAAAWFGLLYLWLEHLGWKWAPLRKIRLIRTPNLNGKWNGKLSSSYFAFDDDKDMTFQAEIEQSWSQMQIHLNFSESSNSTSRSASVFVNRIKPEIVYTYLNDPDPTIPEGMSTHFGTAELTLDVSKSPIEMKGKYYNGRGRGTYGRIIMWPHQGHNWGRKNS